MEDRPEGIILEGILESFAEYYSAELSQKVKRGMRESALKGHAVGNVCVLGYKVGPDKKFQIDPLTAPVVEQIFSLYTEKGMTMKNIVALLNEKGYKTTMGRSFARNSLRKDFLEDLVVKHTIQCILQEEVINALADAILEIQASETINFQLESLKEQKEHLAAAIAIEEIEKPDLTKEHILFWFEQFKNGDISDKEYCESLINNFIGKIDVFDDRIDIYYNYSDETADKIKKDSSETSSSDKPFKVRLQGLEPKATLRT